MPGVISEGIVLIDVSWGLNDAADVREVAEVMEVLVILTLGGLCGLCCVAFTIYATTKSLQSTRLSACAYVCIAASYTSSGPQHAGLGTAQDAETLLAYTATNGGRVLLHAASSSHFAPEQVK